MLLLIIVLNITKTTCSKQYDKNENVIIKFTILKYTGYTKG